LRILFLSDNFSPELNAPASRTHEHARYWVKWGHDVTVLTCAPNFPDGKVFPGYRNSWYQSEIIDGIKVVRVKTYIAENKGFLIRILDYVSFMLSSFVFGLFQKKPDLIVATSPQFFTAVGGWLLAAVRRVPFIFELRDLWPASIFAVSAMKKSFLLRFLERLELFLYRRSRYIVALTNSFKADLVSRGIPENKIIVITNGVDCSNYCPRPKNKELLTQLELSNKFIFGYIGTLGMAHGLNSVLQMANRVRKNSKIHFLFVGSGAEKQHLIETAESMNLTNVTFVPPQPKSNIKNYLSICDIALVHLKNHPVFKTVIPSKIFENMAMGIPILMVSPEGEASSLVKSAGAGLCIPSDNPTAFYEAIYYLFESPENLKKMGRAGREASFGFSRELRAKEMVSVFNLAGSDSNALDSLRTIEKIVRSEILPTIK
jgi:colanic acid biosynthesis glycosyl transferase WcaI